MNTFLIRPVFNKPRELTEVSNGIFLNQQLSKKSVPQLATRHAFDFQNPVFGVLPNTFNILMSASSSSDEFNNPRPHVVFSSPINLVSRAKYITGRMSLIGPTHAFLSQLSLL